jgi:hypothetical protein
LGSSEKPRVIDILASLEAPPNSAVLQVIDLAQYRQRQPIHSY